MKRDGNNFATSNNVQFGDAVDIVDNGGLNRIAHVEATDQPNNLVMGEGCSNSNDPVGADDSFSDEDNAPTANNDMPPAGTGVFDDDDDQQGNDSERHLLLLRQDITNKTADEIIYIIDNLKRYNASLEKELESSLEESQDLMAFFDEIGEDMARLEAEQSSLQTECGELWHDNEVLWESLRITDQKLIEERTGRGQAEVLLHESIRQGKAAMKREALEKSKNRKLVEQRDYLAKRTKCLSITVAFLLILLFYTNYKAFFELNDKSTKLAELQKSSSKTSNEMSKTINALQDERAARVLLGDETDEKIIKLQKEVKMSKIRLESFQTELQKQNQSLKDKNGSIVILERQLSILQSSNAAMTSKLKVAHASLDIANQNLVVSENSCKTKLEHALEDQLQQLSSSSLVELNQVRSNAEKTTFFQDGQKSHGLFPKAEQEGTCAKNLDAATPLDNSNVHIEERDQILDDALALKKLATNYLHPEVGVTSTDGECFGRNYFHRHSAPGPCSSADLSMSLVCNNEPYIDSICKHDNKAVVSTESLDRKGFGTNESRE